MARSMAYQGLLLQREVTPGTPLTNAMKRVLGLRAAPGFDINGEDFKASGYKMNTSRVQNSEIGGHSVDTIQDFNALTWTLTGGYGAPVSSTAVTDAVGDATTHTYELKPRAADTIAAFTAIWGDGTQALQMSHFVFNSLSIGIQRGQLSLSTSAASYMPTTGASIPGSGITEVGSLPVAGRTWDVYCDDAWDDLGTTKLLAAYEGNLDFGTKWVPDWVINSAKTSFDSMMEADDLNPTANLRLGFDATAVGLMSAFTAGTLKFLRFESTGPVIDETTVPADINASITIDVCVRITAPGEIGGAPNSPAVSIPFECQLTVDPVSGKASEATLTNLVTAL